jgi:uncharacterized protein (UPF0332 family)
MNEDDAILYLAKAEESVAGAESELANGRYNNSANRCYYACFQAAIAALLRTGIAPISGRGQWGHDFVQGEFVGLLVNRRKLYPTELRDTLALNLKVRQAADYGLDQVTEAQASRALRRTQRFVAAVERGVQPYERRTHQQRRT